MDLSLRSEGSTREGEVEVLSAKRKKEKPHMLPTEGSVLPVKLIR